MRGSSTNGGGAATAWVGYGLLTRRGALTLAVGAGAVLTGSQGAASGVSADARPADRADAPTRVEITEYDIPTPGSRPGGLVVGPDAAIWFNESVGNAIGRITMDGQITEVPIPTPGANMPGQAFVGLGPDGMVWFTESAANKLGRITPDGFITEYEIPAAATVEDPMLGTLRTSFPIAVTAGTDGAVWFNERETNQIGRMTLDGHFTEYPLPEGVRGLVGLTRGPDGALWFATNTSGHIGRITPDGAVTAYPIPTPMSGALRLKLGPDGAVWFVAFAGNKVGRVTSDGTITEFDAPTGPGPDIAPGPDGAMWFTILNGDRLGRITAAGDVATYALPRAMSGPYSLVTGLDGALWFTEARAGRIGRARLRCA